MQEAEELILFKAPADVQTALIIYQASSTVLSHVGSLEIFSFLIHQPHISESCADEADSGIYMRLNEEKNLSYQVMTKMDMSQLTKYNISAVRSVVPQVLQRLIPSGGVAVNTKQGRWDVKRDMKDIIVEGFFAAKGFPRLKNAATDLISLVTSISFNHIMKFSPAAASSLDNYPTVQTVNPSTNKRRISCLREHIWSNAMPNRRLKWGPFCSWVTFTITWCQHP